MMTLNDNNVSQLLRLIEKSAASETLKKLVLSRSVSADTLKATVTLKSISGETVLQIETMHSDNKAKHKNVKIGENEPLIALIEGFSQINLNTTAGDCEFKRSKSGNTVLLRGDKLEKAFLNGEKIR
jgi:hypothetical protein